MKHRCRLLPLFFLSGFMLSSCGPSSYTKNNNALLFPYGYAEIPMDSSAAYSTYRVTFDGNSATPAETVDRYAIYRGAELTVEKGYDYFVVIDQNQDSKTTTSTSSGPVQTSTSIEHDIDPMTGKLIPVAVTASKQDIHVTTRTEHSAAKTIRMFKGQPPEISAEVYDAKSLLVRMAPYISR